MNGRSGIVTLLLFVFLAILILLQVLEMIQQDRLYERINKLDDDLSQGITLAPAANNTATTTTTTTAGIDEGDWLVTRVGAEPGTLNPYVSSDMAASMINAGIFEGLLDRDPDTLERSGKLAQSWTISDDGLEIIFTLKDNIHFSDGAPVTADDVVFSFETIKTPGIDAPHLANYFKDFEKVEKLSDREVKFTLTQRYFKSLDIVGGMEIIPKHIYAFDDPQKFNERRSDPIGSGPYVFERWEVGREVALRRNERYWDEKPPLKKKVYRFITNAVAAIQALRAEEVDSMTPLPEEFLELSAKPDFREQFHCLKYRTPGNGYFYIGWNQLTPFFNDKTVRLALTHAVDRQAICDHLLGGLASVPTGPFYMYGNQTDSTIEPWPYDLDKARALLDQAGWKDTDGDGIRDKDGQPFRFKYMIVSGAGLHERVVKLVKDAFTQIGIDVTPDPYEWSIFVDKLHHGDFEAVNLAWGGTIESDPYQIWHSSQAFNPETKTGGSNYISFINKDADALIDEARKTLDEAARNRLYHKFHRILHEEQPYTFIYTRPSTVFINKRFHNVKLHKLGLDSDEWYVPKPLQKYK